MRAWCVALAFLLLASAMPAGAAQIPPWRTLAHGREATLTSSGRHSALACSSIAALRAFFNTGSRRSCATWKAPVTVTIVSWTSDHLSVSRIAMFDVAEIRRSDGKHGWTTLEQLIPIPPNGTEIILQQPCYPPNPRAVHARIVSEHVPDQWPRLVVQPVSGSRRTVTITDVTDTSGRAIFFFHDPRQPEFRCGS
jgi:hypothetical protein